MIQKTNQIHILPLLTRQMAILSALIFTVMCQQIVVVSLIFNPELVTSETLTINDDPTSNFKNLAVILSSTGETGTNQDGDDWVVSLQECGGIVNLSYHRVNNELKIVSITGHLLIMMKKLWIVARIVPKGPSTYSDGTAACGLHNFVFAECKCLRYYLDFEKDETITMQTMSLHTKLLSYRYNENRLVFIDKTYDVLQGQYIYSATINAKNLEVSATESPVEEEVYPQFEPFALLGTDNFETYAVYAACAHNTETPLAWIAFAERAYLDGITEESKKAAKEVLLKNGIDISKTVSISQKKCLQIVVEKSNS